MVFRHFVRKSDAEVAMPKLSNFEPSSTRLLSRPAAVVGRVSVCVVSFPREHEVSAVHGLSSAEAALASAMDANPQLFTWDSAVSGVFDIE